MTTPAAPYLTLLRLLIDNLTDEQAVILEAAQQESELCNAIRNALSLPAEAEGSCGPGAVDCGFDWCNNDHPGHKEHTWTDGLTVTERTGRTRRAYTYTSIQEGFTEPVLIGVEDPDDECSGMEAWLSIEDAEYLRDALTKAIDNARTAPVEKVNRWAVS
jgi:hypothetical protein